VKVAACQGPYLPFGSGQGVELIERQLQQCEGEGVELLCCPESFLGGLAYESDGQSPADVALSVGELACLLAPALSSPVASVIGFTERAETGKLYSSVAFVADGAMQLVQRKVYPGYRTAISAGTELPVIPFRDTVFGILICNDIWYAEPARILASKGAELILVPTNSGHLRRDSTLKNRFRTRGETLAVARAVDNTVSIVQADVAGEQQGRFALGCSRILDPDGAVLAAADSQAVGLVIADIEPHSRPFDPRGWDARMNAAVSGEYASMFGLGEPSSPAPATK
jgi:predicted amidohydrolase